MAYDPAKDDPVKGYRKYGGKYSAKYGGQEPYKEKKDYGKTAEDSPRHIKPADVDYIPQRIRERVIISPAASPQIQDVKIKPLKLAATPEIVGGIFDRVGFLENRIAELRANIDLRKKIHENILAEIEKDIDDRQQFILVVTDINEKRNLKLDISVLRRERRNEEVQFWRDLVELDTELKKLEEEYEVESKIAAIFADKEKPAEGAV